MVVGIGTITLRLHGNSSLKGKRKVVKSIMGRVRNTFNVSIAEVGSNNSLERVEIGFAFVGNDRRVVNSKLDKVMNLVEAMQPGEIVDADMEMMSL